MHVAVLTGGIASERDVCRVSGTSCAAALTERGYEVTLVNADLDVVAKLQACAPDVALNTIWGQWGESMNAMLESFDQPMYSFDEGFKPVVVERLWPSSCLNAWRTRVLSLSRSSAKRIHRVMQNLQPDIPVSEWPAEVQSRFKQLKHMIWLRAHFPKVVSSLGIWLVYTER